MIVVIVFRLVRGENANLIAIRLVVRLSFTLVPILTWLHDELVHAGVGQALLVGLRGCAASASLNARSRSGSRAIGEGAVGRAFDAIGESGLDGGVCEFGFGWAHEGGGRDRVGEGLGEAGEQLM